MNKKSRAIVLKNYPTGLPKTSDFEIIENLLPQIKEGEVLVKNLWLSVDPYMRGRMTLKKNYIEPFKIGHPLEGHCIGEIIDTKSFGFKKGDIVSSMFGWRDLFLADRKNIKKIDTCGLPAQTFLGPLGMTGLTAHIGLFEIAKLKKGETVFVSTAAGAVGSMACQFAKNIGCQVIGSTGSDQKVEWLKKDLGIDNAFNYKKCDNLVLKIKEEFADGIDVYFDNVGGEHLEAAIYRMSNFGRIVICGRISQMNTPSSVGIRNLAHVLTKRISIQGFLVFDHLNKADLFQKDCINLIKQGKLKWKETIIEGMENAPQAFIDMLNGKNLGKMLVKI